jgi:hypothetical protein
MVIVFHSRTRSLLNHAYFYQFELSVFTRLCIFHLFYPFFSIFSPSNNDAASIQQWWEMNGRPLIFNSGWPMDQFLFAGSIRPAENWLAKRQPNSQDLHPKLQELAVRSNLTNLGGRNSRSVSTCLKRHLNANPRNLISRKRNNSSIN